MEQPPRLGPVRLVAIDGPGGAGKSVFAARLAAALGDAPIVHTDDFAGVDEPFDWWPALERDVLEPLGRGEAARFAPRDWTTGGSKPPSRSRRLAASSSRACRPVDGRSPTG